MGLEPVATKCVSKKYLVAWAEGFNRPQRKDDAATRPKAGSSCCSLYYLTIQPPKRSQHFFCGSPSCRESIFAKKSSQFLCQQATLARSATRRPTACYSRLTRLHDPGGSHVDVCLPATAWRSADRRTLIRSRHAVLHERIGPRRRAGARSRQNRRRAHWPARSAQCRDAYWPAQLATARRYRQICRRLGARPHAVCR